MPVKVILNAEAGLLGAAVYAAGLSHRLKTGRSLIAVHPRLITEATKVDEIWHEESDTATSPQSGGRPTLACESSVTRR